MFLLVALLLFQPAPDSLTLDAAYRAAETNHPLQPQIELREAMAERRLQNLHAQRLPSLSLGGQATYFSDVPEIPISAPGFAFPELDKDQYKVALTINQIVYDGGLITAQQTLETARRDLDQQQVEVQRYSVREQVSQVFLQVLLLEAQLESLATLHTDIEAKRMQAQALVDQGVALSGNVDVLTAERIKVEQHIGEAEVRRRAARTVLGELMGRPLAEDETLALPNVVLPAALSDREQRPEYRAFALQRTLLDAQQTLIARKNRPTVAAFAETAYGRPAALNVFETDFKPFYTVGVRVNWKAWDWHMSRRDGEVLALQEDMLGTQEAAFARSLRIATAQHRADIERLQALLESDAEIIALRQRVEAQAASRFANGVITATDYLAERNAVHQAELTRHLHRLQLAQAQVQYLNTLGENEGTLR